MSREDEAVTDIERLLALTWRTWGSIPLDPSAITRTWSLDLGWLAPNEAELLLSKLIAAGWLVTSSDGLSPSKEVGDVTVPLGWFPRKRLLDEPPKCPIQPLGSATDETREPTTRPVESEPVTELDSAARTEGTDDPNEEPVQSPIERTTSTDSVDIPGLLQAISDATKLERQEVMRRAQRKRRALGAITVWMALFLVARELGLDPATLLD